MPEFSTIEWAYYITSPSSTQRARVEEELKKLGVKHWIDKGRIYTETRPGIVSDTLKSMGAKLHPIKKAKNSIQLPPVGCQYESGCTFSTSDMDELAEHIQGHYPEDYRWVPQKQEEKLEEEPQIQVNLVPEGENEEEMVAVQTRRVTSTGKQIGKFRDQEIEQLKEYLNQGMDPARIARVMGRRLQAILKKIEAVQTTGSLLPSIQTASKTYPNGPVTSSYTVLGLLKKAQKQSEELSETLGQLVEVLGPSLTALETLLNHPSDRNISDPYNWGR